MKIDMIEDPWQKTSQCERCGIRNLVLFADLTKDDFDLMHRPISDLELKPGATLFNTGDTPDFVYTLRQGLVKLVKYTDKGQQRIVRLLHQGDLVGIEALNGQAYDHYAQALTSISVCRIPVAEIERINFHSPRLYRQLTSRWSKMAREADYWIADLLSGTAHTRVIQLLLYLASKSDTEQFYLPSREDMGAMLAITTETASRTIASLRGQKVLNVLSDHQATADLEQLRLLIR